MHTLPATKMRTKQQL